ncbi:dienelactone hydrolase family protein [Paraburkholderia phenoliruptrix]|uniref:dienelactone hydrolase family protein n=1 Tax=Paraburkholderia phenoliruptrix TaxID=252970 RepID=UPI0001C02F80|nr:dienelactone hydrolase family protein [Paraburkholderia phenoliruptrix]WMY10207.1 dienelactone hydrolase family protein [Paraburkholderia phenoliruptrix]
MKLVKALFVAILWIAAACAHAQSGRDMAAHVEVHQIPSLTVSDRQMLTGNRHGEPVTVAGILRLAKQSGKQPVVVLIHGSSGIGANIEMWERIFNENGIGTFAIDGFTGRGIRSTSNDQSQLGRLNLVLDAYRALDMLARDPRVDPDRIVLMGFSRGGQATLYAAMTRLNRMWNTSGVRFRAYIPFYPDCMTRYRDDTDVDGPIREFHGADDDYDPAPACAAYIGRLREAGKDATMTVFPHASHAFDMPYAMPTVVAKGAQTVRACRIVENASGELINEATGALFSFRDECVQSDPHVGGNGQARDAAISDVLAYLKTLFGVGS